MLISVTEKLLTVYIQVSYVSLYLYCLVSSCNYVAIVLLIICCDAWWCQADCWNYRSCSPPNTSVVLHKYIILLVSLHISPIIYLYRIQIQSQLYINFSSFSDTNCLKNMLNNLFSTKIIIKNSISNYIRLGRFWAA